jgi:hypothetical protein
MSNPNPINLNNLDSRYVTPSSVDTKIAVQAATDAGQYALKPVVLTQAQYDALSPPDPNVLYLISG